MSTVSKSEPGERRGGTCPVADPGFGAAIFGYKDTYHRGTREFLLMSEPMGVFCCDKCKALFEPEEEPGGTGNDDNPDR